MTASRGHHYACFAALILPLLIAAGCASPAARRAALSPEASQAKLLQQQLEVRSMLAAQSRLNEIGRELLLAALPLCLGREMLHSGLTVSNLYAYQPPYRAAARGLGFGDTVIVVDVMPGSAAERAGFRTGDRILQMDHSPAPGGPEAVSRMAIVVAPAPPAVRAPRHFSVRGGPFPLHHVAPSGDASGGDDTVVLRERDGEDELARDISLHDEVVCHLHPTVVKNESAHALTDGHLALFSIRAIEALPDDALAIVVAHVLTHGMLGHADVMQRRSRTGAVLGGILDIAFATQGVYTSNSAAMSGIASIYPQHLEREADRATLYLLALTGRPMPAPARIVEVLTQEGSDSNPHRRGRKMDLERQRWLEEVFAEIDAKRAAGESLMLVAPK